MGAQTVEEEEKRFVPEVLRTVKVVCGLCAGSCVAGGCLARHGSLKGGTYGENPSSAYLWLGDCWFATFFCSAKLQTKIEAYILYHECSVGP